VNFTSLPDDQLLLLTQSQMIALLKSDALYCYAEFDVFETVCIFLLTAQLSIDVQ